MPIAASADGHGGRPGKINEAFAVGYQGAGSGADKRARGFKVLARTLKAQTGLTFDGAALIDFQGFQAVVRELGGVDMCVDQRASSIHLARDRTGKLVHISFTERTKKVYNVPAGARVNGTLADYVVAHPEVRQTTRG